MENRDLDKKEWQGYFDYVSKSLPGMQVEIEVASLDIGDQIQEEWTPLEGLSYDPKDDVLFVHTASLDHAILSPRAINIDGDELELRSVVIQDAEGQTQTIRFRETLALKPGSDQGQEKKGA